MLQVLALYGALLTGACGSDGAKPAGDTTMGDGDGGTPDGSMQEHEDPPLDAGKGEVVIRVDQARRVTRDGAVGNVNVAFTLANGPDSPPASLNLALFSVKTSAGLYVMASAGEPSWVDGELCNPSVSVAEGASSSCALQFELEGDQTPIELFYQTAGKIAGTGSDQRSATAALTVEACTPCGTDCTYLDRDALHCGACDNQLDWSYDDNLQQNINTWCLEGKPACPGDRPELTGCIMHRYDTTPPTEVLACINVMTNVYHCGACGKRVEHGSCEGGQPVCVEGELSTCGEEAFCVDLTQDTSHCGACGHSCDVPPGGRLGNGSPQSFCGEQMPGQCSAYVEFSAMDGDVLAEGDSCTKVCLANGFEACSATSSGCANLTSASLSIGCVCVW